MAALGIKRRFSMIRLMLAFVGFAILLTMIKEAYQPRTYRLDVVLQVVAPADRNETALKTFARRPTSPAVLMELGASIDG